MNAIRNIGAFLSSGAGLLRFIPEPKNRLGRGFLNTMRSLGGLGSSTITLDIDPQYRELIETQIKVQQQMQNVTMESNLEKTRHESKMAALRNLRAA
ncbi:MAG: hypothetical protein D6808_02410 [Candidatus Dadabacteria bacterium]|nr:MAG: hypothetical protein D6808_02410 [Candidatus Dadabacteria bacterium]